MGFRRRDDSHGCCPTHRYGKEGDYKVKLTVTTTDDRTGSSVQTVRGRPTMLRLPRSTHQGCQGWADPSDRREHQEHAPPETVRVELFKSVPGGLQLIASTEQNIPVRSGNRTTAVDELHLHE